MMEEPWFLIEKGLGRYRLYPRTVRGWLAFMLFMAVVLTPVLVLAFSAERLGIHPLWVIAWLPWFGLTMWMFMRWAKSKAKIIDMAAIAEDYDDYLAWKRRQRR